MNRVEQIAYVILGLLFTYGIYLGIAHTEYFNTYFAAEDKYVEYGTAIMLFVISLLCAYRIITQIKFREKRWIFGTFIFFLLFFFASGEEISWGQRIFDIESTTYFKKHNAQGETNLHNLVVGGKKINKIIFSQLFTVVMIVYLVVLPIWYRKIKGIRKLINRFAIPIVKWSHAIAFVVVSVMVYVIPADRKWELYELAFGLIFLLIFLYPLNTAVFYNKAV